MALGSEDEYKLVQAWGDKGYNNRKGVEMLRGIPKDKIRYHRRYYTRDTAICLYIRRIE
jgi:hypothetical protein